MAVSIMRGRFFLRRSRWYVDKTREGLIEVHSLGRSGWCKRALGVWFIFVNHARALLTRVGTSIERCSMVSLIRKRLLDTITRPGV